MYYTYLDNMQNLDGYNFIVVPHFMTVYKNRYDVTVY